MNHIATLPSPNETAPEHLTETYPEVAEALGRTALTGQLADEAYIAEGLKQLDSLANGEPVNKDTRIHDIEAAHEAALFENEVFDAHVAALKEDEIFNAHVAALQEDGEREQAKTAIAVEQKEPRPDGGEMVTLAPNSPQSLREEAITTLSKAGIDLRLSPNSEVSRDTMGNLLILDGADAKLITRSADGSPKLTEYHYDEDSGTLTIDAKRFNTLSNATDYQETTLKNWQTRREVIILPPAIAKRFGIEQAIATT